MTLNFELSKVRQDLIHALIDALPEIPVTYRAEVVGQASLSDCWTILMDLSEALWCKLNAGALKFNFVRVVVPESQIRCGRNQRLVEIEFMDNI